MILSLIVGKINPSFVINNITTSLVGTPANLVHLHLAPMCILKKIVINYIVNKFERSNVALTLSCE